MVLDTVRTSREIAGYPSTRSTHILILGIIRKPSCYHSSWSDRTDQATEGISTRALLPHFLLIVMAAAILFFPTRRDLPTTFYSSRGTSGTFAMPPKKTKAKEAPPAVLPDIRNHWLRTGLRSEAESEGASVITDVDVNVENVVTDSESEGIEGDSVQQEEQMSNNELAKMLTTEISKVRMEVKILNEKFTTNTETIDKLKVTMTDITQRVDTVATENSTITDSVTRNRSDIDDVIKQQNEFNQKHDEIIKLAKSLREKDLMIEHMNRRIENLEDENRAAKDREEIREQHGRKMNLWIYGVDEPEKENVKVTLREFCITVLGLKNEVVDRWAIKNVHRVGQNKMPQRPIIVAFLIWDDRQALLRANKDLFQYNKDNNTNFAVKTDLAPRARQRRKDLNYVNQKMKAKEHCEGRVRDNPKGQVWLERKEKKDDRYWNTVYEIDPDYLPPGLAKHASSEGLQSLHNLRN